MALKELIWTEKNTDSRRKARENRTELRNQSKRTINAAVGSAGKRSIKMQIKYRQLEDSQKEPIKTMQTDVTKRGRSF